MEALIIIDMQNDFATPSGNLYVKDGEKIITGINDLILKFRSKNNLVIATKDFHPLKHISFASTHNKPLYSSVIINGSSQIMWPDHCIQNSLGSEIVKSINIADIDYIVKKGYKINNESYSGFKDQNNEVTKLNEILKMHNIKKITIVGLSFDYCVLFTIKDALELNYQVSTYLELTKSVNPDNDSIIISELKNRNVNFKEVLNYD